MVILRYLCCNGMTLVLIGSMIYINKDNEERYIIYEYFFPDLE